MSKHTPYILWLPGWYPNHDQPIVGDFIQRHAQVASNTYPIQVIFVHRSNKCYAAKQRISHDEGSLIEHVYGYTLGIGASWMHRWISGWLYGITFLYALFKLCFQRGLPRLIHVHVARKNAFFAVLLSKIASIPIVYSEHASFYLKEAPNAIHLSIFRKIYWKWFARQCDQVFAVSRYLADAMMQIEPALKVQYLPNVVDERSLYFDNQMSSCENFTFVFIGSSSPEKNAIFVIEAFKHSIKTIPNARLILIGDFASTIGKEHSNIVCMGEVSHANVIDILKKSHALILYSFFETFGCVVIEANACGLPVIVSDIPSMRALVTNENGLLVSVHDERLLADAMIEIQNNYERFDKGSISKKAHLLYGTKSIRSYFDQIYSMHLR